VTTTGGIGEACNAGGEAHEGILVTVTDVTIETEPNSHGEITINDGSGATQLEDSILDTDTHLSDALGSPLIGQTIESVTGVVRFAYSTENAISSGGDDIAIIGGVVGGIAFTLLLAVLFLLYKKQQKPPSANLASPVPVEMRVGSSTEANPSAVEVSEVKASVA